MILSGGAKIWLVQLDMYGFISNLILISDYLFPLTFLLKCVKYNLTYKKYKYKNKKTYPKIRFFDLVIFDLVGHLATQQVYFLASVYFLCILKKLN